MANAANAMVFVIGKEILGAWPFERVHHESSFIKFDSS